jgi:hypothetical protein
MDCYRNERCECNREIEGRCPDCECERQRGGCDRCEYDCREDRRVIKHCHVVKHKHDIVHEYDVVHKHDYHYYDVVRTRQEEKHHDHRRHKPDYCPEGQCYEENGIEIV